MAKGDRIQIAKISDIPTLPTLATTTQNGLLSATDKVKLNNIANSANNYVHPTTHPASIITQDASRRMVSDTQINTWNTKASTVVVTQTANGLMLANDKKKVDGSIAMTTLNSTDYTISRIRNSRFGTAKPSSLNNGEVFFVYE